MGGGGGGGGGGGAVSRFLLSSFFTRFIFPILIIFCLFHFSLSKSCTFKPKGKHLCVSVWVECLHLFLQVNLG